MKPPSNQPKPLKTYKNRYGTMKNQSGTIKTNLELDRVVMGGSGGYRRLPGGSAHFSLQTDTHFIIIYISSFSLLSLLVLQATLFHVNIIIIIAPALQSISLSGNKCVGNEAFASLIKCDYMLEFHLLSVILD